MNTTCAYFNETSEKRYQLLVFAHYANDKELKKQMDILESDVEGLNKRNIQIQIIYNSRQSKLAFLKYNVPFNTFSLILKDKENKLSFRSDKTISLSQLYSLLN